MIQKELKFEVFEAELLSPLRGHELTELESYVASLLLDASREQPVQIKDIIRRVEQKECRRLDARKVKDIIRTLRKDHAFPILASRKPPAGYWWCSSVAEMEAFIGTYRSQALDELHTLSRIVEHNFPALAGQMRLDTVATNESL